MIDSCRPRKLEPGLAATYSKPSVLRTSTMKSDPLRWLSRRTCTSPGPMASPAAVMIGVTPWAAGARGAGRAGDAACAVNSPDDPTMAAAPASAPFWRNSRRCSTLSFDLFDPAMALLPEATRGGYYH